MSQPCRKFRHAWGLETYSYAPERDLSINDDDLSLRQL
jgi:hypothetical protein